MKKYISLFLAFGIVMQSMIVSMADGGGWKITTNGTVNIDAAKYFASLATDAGKEYMFSGDNSLYIEYPGNTKLETEYIEIENELSGAIEEGEAYTLKYYIKGSRNSKYQEAILGDKILVTFDNISKTKIEKADCPSGQTAWYECAYTFTAESDADKFKFRFYGGTNNAAIDDVSLVKDGSDENLITNGGFEEAVSEEEYVEEEFDRTPYAPENLIATPATSASELILNWRNPEASTLTKVSLYDITGGKNELLSDSIETTKSKIVYYLIDGLTSGETYQYKLVFSFSDKGDFAYYLCGTPSNKTTAGVGKWTLGRTNSNDVNYCPGEVVIDSEVARSGNSSLRMRANIDRNVKELKSNIYISALFSTKMEVGSKYHVSFWVKGEEVKRAPTITMQWTVFDGREREYPELVGDEYDWKQVVLTYTYTEKSNFYFIYDGECKNLWIDDVEIYKTDEDGNVPEDAENLVSEGGFEGIISETVATVSDLTAIPESDGLVLDWNLSEESCEYVEIYEKYYGKDIYIGKAVKDEQIKLTNLIKGREYTFSVVPVNKDNVRGVPQEVIATTILPDYEIGEVILKSEGAVVDRLMGAGTYSVTFSVKNNVFEDGMNVEQFVAVFDENNVLWGIFSTEKKISKTGHGKPFTNISTSFTIPGDNYTAEYFVYDDRETLNIIGEENPHKVYTHN